MTISAMAKDLWEELTYKNKVLTDSDHSLIDKFCTIDSFRKLTERIETDNPFVEDIFQLLPINGTQDTTDFNLAYGEKFGILINYLLSLEYDRLEYQRLKEIDATPSYKFRFLDNVILKKNIDITPEEVEKLKIFVHSELPDSNTLLNVGYVLNRIFCDNQYFITPISIVQIYNNVHCLYNYLESVESGVRSHFEFVTGKNASVMKAKCDLLRGDTIIEIKNLKHGSSSDQYLDKARLQLFMYGILAVLDHQLIKRLVLFETRSGTCLEYKLTAKDLYQIRNLDLIPDYMSQKYADIFNMTRSSTEGSVSQRTIDSLYSTIRYLTLDHMSCYTDIDEYIIDCLINPCLIDKNYDNLNGRPYNNLSNYVTFGILIENKISSDSFNLVYDNVNYALHKLRTQMISQYTRLKLMKGYVLKNPKLDKRLLTLLSFNNQSLNLATICKWIVYSLKYLRVDYMQPYLHLMLPIAKYQLKYQCCIKDITGLDEQRLNIEIKDILQDCNVWDEDKFNTSGEEATALSKDKLTVMLDAINLTYIKRYLLSYSSTECSDMFFSPLREYTNTEENKKLLDKYSDHEGLLMYSDITDEVPIVLN